ncbi:hypothetical protein [Kordiimonas sp.]|uniref:hypothetical protein n=1 Tax=Kordiimonas sp. TaxID=1970157 RepID=UPI003A93C251
MSMPDYVSFSGVGESSWPAPGVFANSILTGFFVPANTISMQALVDRVLNGLPNSPVRYEVLGRNMFCTFMQIGKCYSGSAQTGYFPYREAMLVIPLLQWRKGHILPEIVAWPAYMIPDEVIPTVTGREGWGYPKSIGTIGVPVDETDAAPFTLNTMIFKRLNNDCMGTKQTLFSINHSGLNYSEPVNNLKGMSDVFTPIFNGLSIGEELINQVKARILNALPEFTLTNINLKQFRDASETNKACYQSLTTAPLVMTNFRSGRIITGDLNFFAERCQSHQLIEQFGLAVPDNGNANVPVRLGIELALDFEIRAGTTVWASPS